ncbi:MAG TPA: PLDc N-terminal domain-containing protein [Pyrinomonadaceae bacterium]|nr:PLDc N-terminal domain-containing protein [Pyrinomonadaceae bacterium]
MKTIFTFISAASLIVLNAGFVFAQRNDDADACAGCGICGGSIFVLIVIPLVIIALNIALLVWVARDAKARGMDSAVLWMILVMLTGLLGLVIYLFSRPQGNVVQCQSCGNSRLQASARCPHCGNA